MRKKLISVVLITTLIAGVLTGCGSGKESNNSQEAAQTSETTLKVGASLTPHAEILEKVKPILAKEGVNLEIVKIEDTVTPNTGLVEKSLDANFFQHQPYLDDFNKENKTDLVSAGAVHYEPFGIYAGKEKICPHCRRVLPSLCQTM